MTDMKTAPLKKTARSLPRDLEINRRREWRFGLPLPAQIEGRIPRGEAFKETTVLVDISSGGARFGLHAPIVVGAKLKIVVDVPPKAADGKKVKLTLRGTAVRLEKPARGSAQQIIAVRFSQRFRFVAGSKPK
jgi:hypothetical protein